MTTIVYHDNIIAYDSRMTGDGLIVDDKCNKKFSKNGVLFFISGTICDIGEIIEAYSGGNYNKSASGVSAIIDDHGKIYESSIDKEEGFWKLDITGKSYAIGSGSHHAWTAIDMGCTAAQAVKMAMKRDAFTGGRVRTHKVK